MPKINQIPIDASTKRACAVQTTDKPTGNAHLGFKDEGPEQGRADPCSNRSSKQVIQLVMLGIKLVDKAALTDGFFG